MLKRAVEPLLATLGFSIFFLSPLFVHSPAQRDLFTTLLFAYAIGVGGFWALYAMDALDRVRRR